MRSRREAALLDAALDVTSGVSLRSTLQRIVDNAASLVDARYAALAVRGEDGEMEEFIFSGISREEADEMEDLPQGKGLLGYLLHHPEVVRLNDLTQHPQSIGFPEGHPPMHSFLGVPIRLHGESFGQLYLTEKISEPAFTHDDEEAVVALAAVVGVAVENARSHEMRQALSLIGDRERIARDLHDLVIQRLFATGLSLQAVLRNKEIDDSTREKVSRAVDELDFTVKQIRQTIFALQDAGDHEGLRHRITAEYEAIRSALPFTPALVFEGSVDTKVPPRIGEHAVAVVRELLSNVAKHAQATQAAVVVKVIGEELCITVTDNGIGIGTPSHRRGLANVSQRADRHTGLFTIENVQPHGTRAHWSVLLLED